MQLATLLKVRTITVGITLAPTDGEAWAGQLERAAQFNAAARARYEADGYEVQTCRVSTNPFEEWLDVSDADGAMRTVRALDADLQRLGIELISLGPARTAAGLALVPEIVAVGPRIIVSGAMAPLDAAAAERLGAAALRIAALTPGAEGNFQFCAAFNVPPGIPFFPAAYHDGGAISFAVGCESANVLDAAITAGAPADLERAHVTIRDAFEAALAPIEAAALALSRDHEIAYGGVDASIAPSPAAAPLTDSFERLSGGQFGGAGTLGACALVSSALKALRLRTCGYSGLMLAPMEDIGLAKRGSERAYLLRDLLTYSAVCGLGLDTVPVPGDVSAATLGRLFLDISALAHRLDKPLTARMFPVPGKGAGEMTTFENPHLCNMRIFDLA